MPAILERIKSTVRGRSGSRGSKDESASRSYRSSEEVPKTPTIPTNFQNPSRPSVENSAFHVTAARGVRTSLDNDPFQQRVAEPNNEPNRPRKSDVDSPRRNVRAGDALPNRTSSRVVIQNTPNSSQHSGQKSTTSPNGSALPRNTNFGSDSHVTGGALAESQVGTNNTQKSYPYTDSVEPRSSNINTGIPTTAQRSHVVQPTSHQSSPTDIPSETLPTNRLSSEGSVRRKPVPFSQQRTSERTGSEHMDNERNKEAGFAAGHLKLPEGFDLNNTERTHVTEHQRPAVTHEKIIKQRTEIVQEAISRDIHYHHYYTYLQPVKVVEVLPPRHYFLDHETGVKTEVLPPTGWTMPTSMTPVPQDYTGASGWTRHYLVNDEHPNGILEAPPLKHEGDISNLRKVAKGQAY